METKELKTESKELTIEDLENKLHQVIISSEFFSIDAADRATITMEHKLLDDLSIDSVKLLELLLTVEEDLGFSLEYDDLTMDAFQNIRSLARYLHGKIPK